MGYKNNLTIYCLFKRFVSPPWRLNTFLATDAVLAGRRAERRVDLAGAVRAPQAGAQGARPAQLAAPHPGVHRRSGAEPGHGAHGLELQPGSGHCHGQHLDDRRCGGACPCRADCGAQSEAARCGRGRGVALRWPQEDTRVNF